MVKSQVKIIGLTLNVQFGILQSCHLKFDSKNNLIVVKGKVGSGKSTLQKSLQLGTLGSDTLKNDKALYGKVDQETQLLDGKTKVFVGCKSGKKDELVYVIYTKDDNGNIIKDPVVDGVKLTPATYLKSLQTELTWRMDELTSDNPTTQKNILLQLYKSELADLGVVYDKKDSGYMDSILGKIDLAESKRSEANYKREQVGGFAHSLEPLGIFIDQPKTIPVRVDTKELEEDKNKLLYGTSSAEEQKTQKLEKLKTEGDAVVVEMKAFNVEQGKLNGDLEKDYNEKESDFSQFLETRNMICSDVNKLVIWGCISEDGRKNIFKALDDDFANPTPISPDKLPLIKFDENGKCISKAEAWVNHNEGLKLIKKLDKVKSKYIKANSEDVGEDPDKDKKAKEIEMLIEEHDNTNKCCDMVDAYIAWHDANQEVLDLKKQYAEMLSSINTGVDGLQIFVDRNDEKLSIYLTYDGSYDTAYFNNKKKEQRKLSSYSGTQKPMICLLLQNYLLSKKEKAMRYLWIDNVPIDNKTKKLLDQMGKELDLTIIVNITGDFDHAGLSAGEILLEGGEVFFK